MTLEKLLKTGNTNFEFYVTLSYPMEGKYMIDFETMNQMVYNREDRPEDLSLPEQVAWDGLEYVYGLLSTGVRKREECAAIKGQIGREYTRYIKQFEKIDHDMAEALAIWKAAKRSDDPAVKALLESVR